jgi:ribosomal protein L12E/L44/L45/RPP1/RPP2
VPNITINGKRDEFTIEDILKVNRYLGIESNESNVKALIEHYYGYFIDSFKKEANALGISNEKIEKVIKNYRRIV